MQCPVDGETLVMSDRNGIEIDYCPKCRGVWLDRGELDKIVERSTPAAQPVPLQQPAPAQQQYAQPQQRPERRDDREERYDRRDRRDYRDDDYDDDRRDGRRPRKRESFLSDLFDF
ncbi:zf-TFIIB domain-containing protein [Paracoccus sulfuroxidans]|uniref:Transcription factor zinc-finger domain-containing protein n=1 Tax=Paracoccus sulfuroxidans TaxID=384678 RepID=A0A562NU10_9RHOB|nr:zf-TFIIB domain-containing protein [Paracoccus sulfuroxidans]TWI35659.1 hypothetical protein IQ24_01016 [Paracoccus sulfuroxidans]